MAWFYLSLVAAMFLSTTDALSKIALKDSNVFVIAWARWAFSSPLLLLLLFFIDIPRLDRTFFIVTACAVPLEVLAILLYIRALSISPLSLTVPFLALTPVFLIATSFLFLGEMPDASGVAGIVFIAAGAYILNIADMKKGIFEPIQSIAREKGSVLMIIVAFIYSITSNLGKIAVLHSSPLFFAAVYNLVLAIVLLPFVFSSVGSITREIGKNVVVFLSIGFFYGLMMVAHFSAIRLIEVSYMISVKRMSLIFSVIYGRLLFRESRISERFLGSVIMVSGVVLIVF